MIRVKIVKFKTIRKIPEPTIKANPNKFDDDLSAKRLKAQKKQRRKK